MTDRELMQQALAELAHCRVFVTTREKIKHPEGTELYDKVIEALRARLAQPEPEPVTYHNDYLEQVARTACRAFRRLDESPFGAGRVLRDIALDMIEYAKKQTTPPRKEEPEQSVGFNYPVEFLMREEPKSLKPATGEDLKVYESIAANYEKDRAQPEPEPVAYRHLHEDGWEYYDAPTGDDCRGCQPLYTAPPQREWQGLTDEEQTQVAWSCGAMSADWLEFAQAIEAKLKEKNV